MPPDLSVADLASGITERMLVDAGLRPGWSVLDVGCGGGAVSFMAAALVGWGGKVVGIDRDPRPLAAARERAREQGLANVTFTEADLATAPPEAGGYAAVIGRRVLMYQPDVAAAVGRLADLLRPGGIMAFQEHSRIARPEGTSLLPLHERVNGWLWRTVEREGGDPAMGFGLAGAMLQSGLQLEGARAEAIVQTPTAGHHTGFIVRAVLPRIVGQGVATAEEVDVDTLDQRLAAERAATGATYVGELVFTAWARKPG